MKKNEKYELKTIVVGPLAVNCYLLTDISSGQTAIIDPGDEPEAIIKELKKNRIEPSLIINTHGHADHISADKPVKEVFNIPIYIHSKDALYLTNPALNGCAVIGYDSNTAGADILLAGSEVIKLGKLELKIIHTPGHTPGGICILTEDLLFTGDTLFCGSVGRWDFTGGNKDVLFGSLNIFKGLSPELIVLPGHGPASSIKRELETNPFLNGSEDL